ncbi:hypothetical protein F3J14_21945 [Burkholderia sp. Tr-862]|nr:hypothetical protein [Burkholderia sp. Tr-862]
METTTTCQHAIAISSEIDEAFQLLRVEPVGLAGMNGRCARESRRFACEGSNDGRGSITDRARIAGQQCERDYDALTAAPSVAAR